ncbi:S-layer homology domain-containing protein [Paenibacillus soyae]|uniref:S-layer homology domain-containing protein n=1 Tax=Paenibacillus soyae TaxID=2969249 RepID=A0A9X2MTD5_9BACL|nr:S-layer homology domain-containing protein [Paenibacillus soyae]MCR2806636.1 S-layer homology domain-containing protein [Paenibacillus soyae]
MSKRHHKRLAWLLSAALLIGALATPLATNTAEAYRVKGVREVAMPGGFQLSTEGLFDLPSDIAIDADGNRYVVDQNNNRIQKFKADGSFERMWGTQGSGNGQFNSPEEIEVDADGNVYVLDKYNYRVQRFDADGKYWGHWGSYGDGDAQFKDPTALALDAEGNVYIGDTSNFKIRKFSNSGALLAVWNGDSSGPGNISFPEAIDVDADGNVYVADYIEQYIIKLDQTGQVTGTWGTGSNGNADGQLYNPKGLAVDGNGDVYVADTYNHRIQKFAADGTFLAKWGSEGNETGQFRFPMGMTLDDEGHLLVADGQNARIQQFSADEEEEQASAFGSYGSINPRWGPGTVDADGNLYVLEYGSQSVMKFDSTGVHADSWGGAGSDPGRFFYPSDLETDAEGNVYVSDSGNYRIQKFDGSGEFVEEWRSEGDEEGQFNGVGEMGRDRSGNLYVLDEENHRMQKFDPEGELLLQWPLKTIDLGGEEGEEDGELGPRFFAMPLDIAVDGNGNVYLMFEFNGQVVKYDTNGNEVGEWSAALAGEEWIWDFDYSYQIEADASGSVYVMDPIRGSIKQFSSDGRHMATWGENEEHIAQPVGFSLAPDGRFYVWEAEDPFDSELVQIRVYERYEQTYPDYVPAPAPAPVDPTKGHLTLAAGQAGEVSLDNEAFVSVPAGAADRAITITIEKASDAEQLIADRDLLSGAVFELLKDMTDHFKTPVTVSFVFDPEKLGEGQRAGIFYYDEQAREWIELSGFTVKDNRISAPVDHFTKFAVLAIDDVEPPAIDFEDTDGHWAQEIIKQAVGRGVVKGYEDGTFRPDQTVTRAEFTKMLANALELPEAEGQASFADDAEIGEWAKGAVASAAGAGFIQGYKDGTFRPNAPISRAAMAKMIAAALEMPEPAGSATGFADDADIPSWAKGAAGALREAGIMEGKGADAFAPSASATRAEAAKLIVLMLEKLELSQ